jgi:hypothetical protein
MKVLHYPAGDHYIHEPIVLGMGDMLTGEGSHTRLIGDNSFDLVQLNSSEDLDPISTIQIRDIALARTQQAAFDPSMCNYTAAIRAIMCTGFSIENVWIKDSGIGIRLDKDAHAGFIDKSWIGYNRVGIFLGDSGEANITDVYMQRLFMIGEFGYQPNDDLIGQYNFGIYQDSKTCGDVMICDCTVLRYDQGIFLKGKGGALYNHNLRLNGNTIDQCNGGLYLENFQNTRLLDNHVMIYAKRARYIKQIKNCVITPKKYENFNIFRGKGGLK